MVPIASSSAAAVSRERTGTDERWRKRARVARASPPSPSRASLSVTLHTRPATARVAFVGLFTGRGGREEGAGRESPAATRRDAGRTRLRRQVPAQHDAQHGGHLRGEGGFQPLHLRARRAADAARVAQRRVPAAPQPRRHALSQPARRRARRGNGVSGEAMRTWESSLCEFIVCPGALALRHDRAAAPRQRRSSSSRRVRRIKI